MSAIIAKASILRFNAVYADLIPTQGQGLAMRLQGKIAALLSGFIEFRCTLGEFCHTLGKRCWLPAGVEFCSTLALPEKQGCVAGVDKQSPPRQYARACFNQPPRFAVLKRKGRYAAHKAAIVLSANPLLPFNGEQGQGGCKPAGLTFHQYCEPCPMLAAYAFRRAEAVNSNQRKAAS